MHSAAASSLSRSGLSASSLSSSAYSYADHYNRDREADAERRNQRERERSRDRQSDKMPAVGSGGLGRLTLDGPASSSSNRSPEYSMLGGGGRTSTGRGMLSDLKLPALSGLGGIGGSTGPFTFGSSHAYVNGRSEGETATRPDYRARSHSSASVHHPYSRDRDVEADRQHGRRDEGDFLHHRNISRDSAGSHGKDAYNLPLSMRPPSPRSGSSGLAYDRPRHLNTSSMSSGNSSVTPTSGTAPFSIPTSSSFANHRNPSPAILLPSPSGLPSLRPSFASYSPPLTAETRQPPTLIRQDSHSKFGESSRPSFSPRDPGRSSVSSYSNGGASSLYARSDMSASTSSLGHGLGLSLTALSPLDAPVHELVSRAPSSNGTRSRAASLLSAHNGTPGANGTANMPASASATKRSSPISTHARRKGSLSGPAGVRGMDGSADDNEAAMGNAAEERTSGPNSASANRRLAHLQCEQRRRESINGGFATLREILPETTATDSKAAILQKAINYIKHLEQAVRASTGSQHINYEDPMSALYSSTESGARKPGQRRGQGFAKNPHIKDTVSRPASPPVSTMSKTQDSDGVQTPRSIQLKQEEDELMEIDQDGGDRTWTHPRDVTTRVVDVEMSDSDDRSDSRRFSVASQLSPPISQTTSAVDLALPEGEEGARGQEQDGAREANGNGSASRHVSALDLLVGVAEHARRSVMPGHGKMSLSFFGNSEKKEKKAAAAAAAAAASAHAEAVSEKKATWAHVEATSGR